MMQIINGFLLLQQHTYQLLLLKSLCKVTEYPKYFPDWLLGCLNITGLLVSILKAFAAQNSNIRTNKSIFEAYKLDRGQTSTSN